VCTDVDPACLPRPVAAVDVRRPGSAIDPRQLESATSVSVSSTAVAQPARLDVAYARAYCMTLGIRPTVVDVGVPPSTSQEPTVGSSGQTSGIPYGRPCCCPTCAHCGGKAA